MRTWQVTLAALGLSACASAPLELTLPAPDSTALNRALSGELLLGAPVSVAQLPELALFELTPAMAIFAQEHTQHRRTHYRRAEALHRALLSSSGLGIRYYPYHTFTAQETFSARQANCVSLSLLYVLMARHLGLDAHFNEVDVPDVWDLQEHEAFILLRHVNVQVNLPDRSRVIVDMEMERYSPAYPQRVIGEDLMAALFYNNRAMERLGQGNYPQAFLYGRRALEASRERAYLWSNMAVLYRRAGHHPEAEALYLQALQVAPDDLSAISNLASLYRLQGRAHEAQTLQGLAERYRERNPYYLYTLAQRESEPAAALALVRRALALQDGEPRFYRLAAELYRELGDERRAVQMERRARAAEAVFFDEHY